jgi:ribonuclease HI
VSHDPRAVLEALAASLDAAEVLARFPGLSREDLRRAVADAASRLPRREAPRPASAPAGGTGPREWPKEITAYIDGAARGNPGEAGAGVLLRSGSGETLQRIARYLGRATNNTAEYQALLTALARAREVGAERVRVYSDSELLVNQVNGRYKTRVPHLQQYLQEAIRLIREIGSVEITHVRRELNAEADALANEAIDGRGAR